MPPSVAQVIFVAAAPFIGQMRKLHRRHRTVDNQCRTQPRAQTQKKHATAFVAADRLHRSIIHEQCRPAKGFAKVKTNPTASEIERFGDDHAVHDHAGISDRYHVIFQIAGQPQHPRNHPARREGGAGFKLTHVTGARNPGLDMTAADIDDEYASLGFSLHDARTIAH